MGRFQVFETPLALDRYKQASTDLLAMLDRVVYPALREDPANCSPLRAEAGGVPNSPDGIDRCSPINSTVACQ